MAEFFLFEGEQGWQPAGVGCGHYPCGFQRFLVTLHVKLYCRWEWCEAYF
jgi:hypothetical protein